MFNLFVLGSVQKPKPADLRRYLPSIQFFGKSSGLLDGIAKTKANQSDLEALRASLRSNWQAWCQPGERICESEVALSNAAPDLVATTELHTDPASDALIAAVDNLVDSRMPQVRDAIPTLFATMAAWFTLNEKSQLVEQARDLIKVAALCVHFEEMSKSGANLETKRVFASDFMRKANPSLDFALPPSSRPIEGGASAPIGRAEREISSLNVTALQTKINLFTQAIEELEALNEAKIVSTRYAPPTVDTMLNLDPSMRVFPSVGANEGDKRSLEKSPQADDASRKAAALQAEHRARQAAENYQQSLLKPTELRTLSASTRKMLAPFKEKQGAVNAQLAITQLRAKRKILNNALIATPFEIPRAEPWMIAHGFMFNLNQSVFDQISCEPPPKPCHCDLLKELDAKHAGLPQLFVLGTGTAYRIDTKFTRYKRGELVHTEPIIAGSTRTSAFRLLNRTEDTTETFTSREEEQEQEATTDDRFKLEKEIAQETKSESEMNMGASMSASYGSVSLAANFGMSSSTATQSKEKQAQEIAQQKTSRALSRIRTKTEERKSSRRLSENERTTGFSLRNDGPSRTAFYHAIDAEYTNQLVCIGTRMVVRVCMQEFMAPLLHTLMSAPESVTTLSKPIAPNLIANPFKSTLGTTVLLKQFSDITPDNYESWLATFDIADAPPPPQEQTASIQASLTKPVNQWDLRAGGGSIPIPSGYIAYSGSLVAEQWAWGPYQHFWLGTTKVWSGNQGETPLNNLSTSVPWSHLGIDGFAINIVIRCKPSAEKFSSWQMKIYDLIWSKYRKELSDYENSLQMAKVEAGIAISGRNPRQNEKFVREELMKMVLGATFPQFYYRGLNAMKFGYKCFGKDEKGNPITTGTPIPEPDFLDAKAEAPWVTFMSKLYEFENMTFDLKPYFFANRAKWCTLRKLTDADPRMEAALSAGYVVIDVPVSLGMEDAFNHYVATGEIWNGQGMPVVGDALYQALALEVMNGQNPQGIPTTEPPWTTVLPTSLVMVSDDPPPDL